MIGISLILPFNGQLTNSSPMQKASLTLDENRLSNTVSALRLSYSLSIFQIYIVPSYSLLKNSVRKLPVGSI